MPRRELIRSKVSVLVQGGRLKTLLGRGRVAILCLAMACGSSEPEPSGALVQRWIEEDAQTLLEASTFEESRAAFFWRFETSTDLALLDLRGQRSPPRWVQGGLAMRSLEPSSLLERAAEIAAADVDMVEVSFTAAVQGRATLSWSRGGETFSSERSLEATPDSTLRSMRFVVAAEPAWSGTIDRLRLQVQSEDQRSVVVRSISGHRSRLDAEALIAAAQRPWRLTLADDTRNAVLSPPGVALERRVQVPEEGVLTFAYAVWPRALVPVKFRVKLAFDDETPQQVFEAEHEARWASRWVEARVDLSRHAGRLATVTLETATRDEPDLGLGMPVWANPQVASRAEARRPNVLMLSIDTLRADHTSLYGYSRPTTPRLEVWARSGVRFETVVASAPWTLPSHTTLFTGLDALSHGVNHDRGAPARLDTLAERLRRAGYTTAAFTAGGYLYPQYGLSQGFDIYRTRTTFRGRDGGRNTILESLLADASAWLDRNEQTPFFLFFHTYAVHDPYIPRQPFYEAFTGRPPESESYRVSNRLTRGSAENGFQPTAAVVLASGESLVGSEVSPEVLATVVAAYDSGVAYMDDHVGRFLLELEASGRLSNTIVVLTSDHGEMLGEQGLLSHRYLYDGNLLVPLVVSLPGGEHAGQVVTEQVRLVDVTPTLLDLVGLPQPEPADGSSLVPLLGGGDSPGTASGQRRAWSYAPWSIRGVSLRVDNRTKYLFRNTVWGPIRGLEELYDLRRDPFEASNLAAEPARLEPWRSGVRERLRSDLSGLRLAFANPGPGKLTGSLGGPMIQHRGLTSEDLPCDCVTWTGAERVHFEVPARTSYTLVLELAGPSRLEIEAQLTDGGVSSAFSESLELGQITRPLEIRHVEGEWKMAAAEGSSSPPASASLRLWWTRGPQLDEVGLPTDDEKIRRQLEALGYIN